MRTAGPCQAPLAVLGTDPALPRAGSYGPGGDSTKINRGASQEDTTGCCCERRDRGGWGLSCPEEEPASEGSLVGPGGVLGLERVFVTEWQCPWAVAQGGLRSPRGWQACQASHTPSSLATPTNAFSGHLPCARPWGTTGRKKSLHQVHGLGAEWGRGEPGWTN